VRAFNPGAAPPWTDFKDNLVEHGMSIAESYIVQLIRDRRGEFVHGVIASPLHEICDRLSANAPQGVKIPQAALLHALKEANWKDMGRLASGDFPSKKQIFAAPDLARIDIKEHTAATPVPDAGTTPSFQVNADTFTRVGLAGCDMGACALLPRLIGQGRASELLYTGRQMDATEGERWGFYNAIVEPDALLVEATKRAAHLANGPAFAHAMTKAMLQQEWNVSVDQAIEMEAQAQVLCMGTQDFRRAYEAFANKQRPVFEGN
jgi:hypothetical protein